MKKIKEVYTLLYRLDGNLRMANQECCPSYRVQHSNMTTAKKWLCCSTSKRRLFLYEITKPYKWCCAKKIAALEGGVGAMLTSSGQAANFYAVIQYLRGGRPYRYFKWIYGGTFNLFGVTLKNWVSNVHSSIPKQRRGKYRRLSDRIRKCCSARRFQTPGCNVLDIEIRTHRSQEWCASDCRQYFRYAYQLSSFLNGELISWPTLLQSIYGRSCYVGRWCGCRQRQLRLGCSCWEVPRTLYPGRILSRTDLYEGIRQNGIWPNWWLNWCATLVLYHNPHNAFLLNLGLETLHLRVPQHCKNAQKVANFCMTTLAWLGFITVDWKTTSAINWDRSIYPAALAAWWLSAWRWPQHGYQIHGFAGDDCYRHSRRRCTYMRTASCKSPHIASWQKNNWKLPASHQTWSACRSV